MAAIELHGMTWDHSRGYPCMVAVSQRYEELHPHVKNVLSLTLKINQ